MSYGYHNGYSGISLAKEVEEVMSPLSDRLIPILDRSDWYEAFPGKSIPYFGTWEFIDFEKGKIVIGLHEDGDVGLLPRNKWGLEFRSLTDSEKQTCVSKLDSITLDPSKKNLEDFHEWIQSIKNNETWKRVQ